MQNFYQKSSLLIATPQMLDPYFSKTVIFMEEFNEDGAVGFVINRPSTTGLNEALTIEGVSIPNHIPTWIGGPVDTSTGIILKMNALDDQSQMEVATSVDAIKDLIETQNEIMTALDKDPDNVPFPFRQRFVVGYAGWGPGQLDEEIRQGGWLQLPYDEHLCFSTNWQKMWDLAIGGLGVDLSSLDPNVHDLLN